MIIFLLLLCALLLVVIIILAKKHRELKRISKDKEGRSIGQLDTLERELQEARRGRHDLKNHLLTTIELINRGEEQQASEYLQQLIDESEHRVVGCGNAVIDSIIKAKTEEMKRQDIIFKLSSTLPRRLELSPSQITCILANLLDNAITAAARCEFKYIDLKMNYSKGNLIIMIKNPFVGEVIKKNDRFLTTKEDKDEHGIGLMSVQRAVERRGGRVEIESENNIFSVFVMVPG